MPPAFLTGFSRDGTSKTSFGSDMGTVVVPKSDPSIPATSKTPGSNMTIEVGKTLMRGSWNAQPYVIYLLHLPSSNGHNNDVA